MDGKVTFASGPHLTGYVTNAGTILPFSTDKVLDPYSGQTLDAFQSAVSTLFAPTNTPIVK